MKISGKVKSISPNFPYTVTMENGDTFTSHFLFRVGAKIKLDLKGNVFDAPWPTGFWHCEPNGQQDYILSPEQIQAAKDPNSIYLDHCLPFHCRKAITDGPQKWTHVWTFYTYHYTAKFDAATRRLTTNYALR